MELVNNSDKESKSEIKTGRVGGGGAEGGG